MTVYEYVDRLERPAFIFHNGFTNTYMYFIPICDYDDVIINPNFDAFSYTQVVKDGEVICDLMDLIKKPFLMGDEHIFIVPERFNDFDLPEENIIYPKKKS